MAKKSPVKEIELRIGDLTKRQKAVNDLKGMSVKNGKGALRIAKLISILEVELKIYADATDKLIKAHGEPRSNGVGHWIDPKNVDDVKAFNEAHEELLDEKIAVRYRPLREGDFGTVQIPLSILADLSIFLDFEDEEIEEKEQEAAEESSE